MNLSAPPPKQLPLDFLAIAYSEREGEACARSVWSVNHALMVAIIIDFAIYFALCGPLALFTAAILTLSLCLAVTVMFRFFVVLLSVFMKPEVKVSAAEVEATASSELPVFTILVPLYREANVAGSIIKSISQLQYPRELLDVKLLLEEDDELTTQAVRAVDLGSEFDVVLVGPSHPRTKPKACNHGLTRARGEFVVIFDAEDKPEPDQLLKAVCAFRNAEPNVACLQAKLNYFNAREKFITRSFALEYTAWFDMVLPGLQLLNAPIPLGGTSNHFRTKILQELGGWDPFNVTEDCDLGIRLSIRKYRTMLLDSTTWEEANTEVGNWIRQRSRWIKGYMQTHFVHTKHPLHLIQDLGYLKTLYFLLTVGGVAVMQLLNLVLWTISFIYLGLLTMDLFEGRGLWTVIAGSRDEYRIAWKMLFLGPGEDPVWSQISLVAFCASVLMFLANGFFVGINLLACRKRNYRDLWIAALLSPLYWTLASVAAWKGAIQLIRNPHFWEKTVHGLTNVSVETAVTDVVPVK